MAISVSDVQNYLNRPHVTNINALCVDASINPYSKYCPIDSSFADLKTDGTWAIANYGFWIPEKTSASSISAYVNNGTKPSQWSTPSSCYVADSFYVWKRKKPRGGSSSFYRLGDFDGYTHNATAKKIVSATVKTSTSNTTATDITNSTSLTCNDNETLTIAFSSSNSMFSITDFGTIADCYPAIIQTTGNLTASATSKISSATSFTISDLWKMCPTEGTSYKICLAGSGSTHATGSTSSDNDFVILPIPPFSLKVNSVTKFEISYDSHSYSSGYTVKMKIKNTGSVVANPSSAKLEYGTTTSLGYSTTSTSISSINVGSSTTITFSISNTTTPLYIKGTVYWNNKSATSSAQTITHS